MNQVIVLAGGKGKRMEQLCPKVLTEIAGEPMILRLIRSVESICHKPTMIVGFGFQEIIEKVGKRVNYVFQNKQLGTGHAVACAKKELEKKNFDNIIVVPGDHPLLRSDTIKELIASHQKSGAVITVSFVSVDSYEGIEEVFYNCGRVIKNARGEVIDIVELKDANDSQKELKDVNVSYYCFDAKWLWKTIGKLKNDNKAKEYYLTDLIKIAVDQNEKINSFNIKDSTEGMGVNTPEQRSIMENIIKKQS